ncbi:AAA-10 domain containing protein, partial [Pyrenophora tritici-repentis]
LDLQQRQEYHGGSVFWSPRKIREARAREVVRERDKIEEKLQKAQAKKQREEVQLQRQVKLEEKRVERQRLKEIRELERAEKAAERARKVEAQHQKKATQQAQQRKRKASRAPSSKNKRQKRAMEDRARDRVASPPSPPPPKTTSRGRNVNLPQKFRYFKFEIAKMVFAGHEMNPGTRCTDTLQIQQRDPPRTSAPQLPSARAVSSSISTSHAQTPQDIGPSSPVSSVIYTSTVPQTSDPDIPASQPVGEASVPSPPLGLGKSTPPAQPLAPQQSSSQPSDTPSSPKVSLVAISEAECPSDDHSEQPAATENSVGSRSAQFQAALFNFSSEQKALRENVFSFVQPTTFGTIDKSSNAPPLVFGATLLPFSGESKRKDTKLADGTASVELQSIGWEKSLQKLSGESSNVGRLTFPANNAQHNPTGKSESTQCTIHAPSSSKTFRDEIQQNVTTLIKKDPAPTATLYKAPSGKEPVTASTSVAGPSAPVRTNGQSLPTTASTSASASIPIRVNGPIQPVRASVSASRPSTSSLTNSRSQPAIASTSAPTNSIRANDHSQPDTQERSTASVQPTIIRNPSNFNRFSLLLKKGRNGGKANIIQRDIRQGPLLSGEIVEKFSKTLVPQYGLLGSLAGEDVSSPSSQIFSNPSTPFSAFICGVQGSGKSHTTACLLENSMICSDNIGRLRGSVSSLVFSYGSSDGNNISEVAYLGASKPGFDNHHAKKVTVLVSPSNKAIGKRYEELPNVRAIPFYLNAKTLTIHAMTMLMAFDEKAVKPMYMSIVESVLRDMATKSLSDNAPLNYHDFKNRIKNEGLDPKQKKTLDNRLKVLETFLDLNGRFPQPQYAPGEITIMDLSDNQLSSTTACILFKLGLENFLKSSATGKMVVLDEAHKYMGDTPGAKLFSDGLGRAIREMRHEGLRVIISTQEPTVANELIALCSVTIIHRFSSPTWYSALKKHINALDEEQNIMHQIEELSTGEALVYAPTAVLKENDDGSLVKATGRFLKIDVRDRVTEDGGESRLAA